MEILRIETHAQGEGPYQLGIGGSTANGQEHRPAPWEDFKEWYKVSRKDFFFGFVSMKQLLLWWNGSEVEYMLLRGLQISVYEVPSHKVLRGTCQVAFEMHFATYVRKEKWQVYLTEDWYPSREDIKCARREADEARGYVEYIGEAPCVD